MGILKPECFNFSHGDHDEQKMRMDMLKELRKELKCILVLGSESR